MMQRPFREDRRFNKFYAREISPWREFVEKRFSNPRTSLWFRSAELESCFVERWKFSNNGGRGAASTV